MTDINYVPADGRTIEEMRENLLTDPAGKELYESGDCKLVWVNEGDLYSVDDWMAPVDWPAYIHTLDAVITSLNEKYDRSDVGVERVELLQKIDSLRDLIQELELL